MLQIKVGKAPINDIVINDTFVSREHLEIFIDSDKNVFITDLDSANGTYVNGIRIKNSVKLETFDILLIGNTLIEWPQFLIDGYNVDKVYETLKDPPLLAKDPQEIENNKLKPVYKYSLISILILIVLFLVLSFVDENHYDINNVIGNTYETIKSNSPIGLNKQKKQRTTVTYDFSCLSNTGDIGSNDAIYNFFATATLKPPNPLLLLIASRPTKCVFRVNLCIPSAF